MTSLVIQKINKELVKQDNLNIRVGQKVRVHVKVKEGDKEKIQTFEGTVIARKGRGGTETFTVRRVAYGVGIERVFPLHSPFIEKIEVVKTGLVRRAKLYYLRNRTEKSMRLKTKEVSSSQNA